MLEAMKNETQEKMDKSMETLRQHFHTLRTGRAATSTLDPVEVEAYGVKQPLKAVATLSTPDAHTILITPWDKNLLAAIEKAIIAANIGLTPGNDGKVIRLNVPPLTTERRKEIVKDAHKMAEESRVAVRNVRRHTNDAVKKLHKDKKVSEDEMSVILEEIQKMTDRHIQLIDSELAAKEQEIMHI